MIFQFFSWYFTVQLTGLVALPLTASLLGNLPDRGYAFAKSFGIFLTSLLLWLGTSYGLMRNETGGAWLALFIVGGIGLICLRGLLASSQSRGTGGTLGAGLLLNLPPLRYIVSTELLFLLAFALWAYVRAHDPAADHTEQPMDLMFMNGIWHSPTYPPQDPWLAGYAISYYYFGYWMLTTLARLAGLTPAVAYNVGQACWWGLLLLGSFGIVYNLVALANQTPDASDEQRMGHSASAYFGGWLGAIAVGASSNLMGPLEWLYARGVQMERLTSWLRIENFPPGPNPVDTQNLFSGCWFWLLRFDFESGCWRWWVEIPGSWWWWRSARVIEDLDLAGNHIEVIDEFPIFSYVLGDNHPHVLAMPFALLAVALALNLVAGSENFRRPSTFVEQLAAMTPLGHWGLLLTIAVSGGLIFLNTWDFPPYWLLLVVSAFVGARLSTLNEGDNEANLAKRSLGSAVALGILIPVGALLIYLPYFVSAQSQAGGFLPNFFYPTRFGQFLVMFGGFLPAVVALILLAWRTRPIRVGPWLISIVLLYGLPLIWLVGAMLAASSFEAGREVLDRVQLPAGLESHTAVMVARWTEQPWTFLLLGLLLSCLTALAWTWLRYCRGRGTSNEYRATLFAMLMASIGLLLIYAPEFVYLKDNFGTRMNTVFKFYYQAWLLLGLSSAYAISRAWSLPIVRGGLKGVVAKAFSGVAALLILAGLIYPIAGAYSKTGGFSSDAPTFDATAYVTQSSADEEAALRWIRENTPPSALVLEAKGLSYRSNYNRVSTMTGRPTLMGWDGHESQWRGKAFVEMAAGRAEAIERIYRARSAQEVTQTLEGWNIDYVFVGPIERESYQITSRQEELLAAVMDLVFESDNVRIYARR